MQVWLGESKVLSRLEVKRKRHRRASVCVLEGTPASRNCKLNLLKVSFSWIIKTQSCSFVREYSSHRTEMPFRADPGAECGGSKEVGREGASVFHVSDNQFLSGASSGTGSSLHNASASDQGKEMWSHKVLVACLQGNDYLVPKPKWILGHGWKVSLLSLFSVSPIPSCNWKLLSSLSRGFFLFLLFQRPL